MNPPTMKKQADETKFDFTVLEGDHLTLFNGIFQKKKRSSK